MEPVAFDDSMEVVASEAGHGHAGHIDDIEIDLDLAQDRIPEDDNDVVVEDASATASDHPTGEEEGTYDADMADGEFLGGDISGSGYHQGPQESYQFEDDSAYHDPNEYEAEMEDEYEEDIDAPIPDNGVQDTNEPNEEAEEEEKIIDSNQPVVPQALSKPEQGEAEASGTSSRTEQEPAIETGIEEPSRPEKINSNDDTHTLQAAAVSEAMDQAKSYEDDTDKHSAAEGEPTEGQVQFESQGLDVEQRQEAGSDITETYHLVQPEDYEDQSVQEEGEHAGNGPTLHAVKVLYQDNEISLFPPVEGDPSETFFLEDEELAHTPIGQLVEACRQVLGDHIGEDEELIMDIECLSLHLPEVRVIPKPLGQNFTNVNHQYSIGKSTISLAQIIRVYLDLCLHDGINDPEPLYISLSTRSTFEADFRHLTTVAQEGKGLSYIQTWEDYDLDKAEGDVSHPDGEEGVADGARALSETHSDHLAPLNEEEVAPDTTTEKSPPGHFSQGQPIESADQGPLGPTDSDHHPPPSFDHAQTIQDELQPSTGKYDTYEQYDTRENGGGEFNQDGGEESEVQQEVEEEEQEEEEEEEEEEVQEEQGEEGGDEREEYEEENLQTEDTGSAVQADAVATDRSPAPAETMHIPTVDLSRDESDEQPPENYTQRYEFGTETTFDEQQEATPNEELAEQYEQEEPQEEHVEHHTEVLAGEDAPDSHDQPATNNDLHIEIDLGTNDISQSEQAFDSHDLGDVDEGEIYEESSAMERTNTIPLNAQENQPPTLVVEDSAERPTTPEPTDDIFDIDEDLFKSPMAENHDNFAPGSPLGGPDPELFSFPNEKLPTASPTLESGEISSRDGSPAGDLNEPFPSTSLDREIPGPDTLPAVDSPKSTAKRTFIDADINDAESSTPDMKRHRSE
ncbi:hypothetical protein FQN52_009472 [Onygenales sp. PD_12]|nr:hypothetical protein FQN52_009472 [Onygenales sp. PD_12]